MASNTFSLKIISANRVFFTGRCQSVIVPGYDGQKEVLAHHEECWLRFSLEDICYIIVPDENAVKKTILTIRGLDIKEEKKDILVSKIEISKRFSEDM